MWAFIDVLIYQRVSSSASGSPKKPPTSAPYATWAVSQEQDNEDEIEVSTVRGVKDNRELYDYDDRNEN